MFSIFVIDVSSSFQSQELEILHTRNMSDSSIDDNEHDKADRINRKKNYNVVKKFERKKTVCAYEKSDERLVCTEIPQTQGKISIFWFLH